ncbi:MAG TPA: DNA replication/repair protein RecF [Chloroflexota bacterium]|nr:DNA replication/repair protein RecF [Chloroflexota bacterium]
MRLRHLALTYFRNYDRLNLELPPAVTVFWGDNAQGKSNLLEAVYYLATMRSFRAGLDRNVMSWSEGHDPLRFTRIAAQLERFGNQVHVDIVIRENSRGEDSESSVFSKKIKINDVPRRAIDVVGTLIAVIFSPLDLQLIEGSPSVRRRYLDVTLSQEDPKYCRGLAHYNRVLIQRNHLLRSVRDRGPKIEELHFWDDELVDAGSYLVWRRRSTVAELAVVAQESYATLSRTAEDLTVGYRTNVFAPGESEYSSIEDIRAAFRAKLVALHQREVRFGQSLIGPHRDDLTFSLDGNAVSEFGSRGQQRTVALALKFAEMEHLARETGESPVLLLDDVFSELDGHRRERVLDAVRSDQQVFITSADPRSLTRLASSASWVRVSGGKLESQVPTTSAVVGSGVD